MMMMVVVARMMMEEDGARLILPGHLIEDIIKDVPDRASPPGR